MLGTATAVAGAACAAVLLGVGQIWDPSNHAEPVMIFGCGRAVASDPVQCRPDPLGR
ncbi:hypothetical protein ACIBG0_19880 [Nocardia sp. NPDC050630]|uniref:hypothetical protein n=1 Tax=Nocardia sp. NPDC050630 TaxID=3364321 RepID=UPI0037881713